MYCGHACLCMCLSVCPSVAACLHYCTDPNVTSRSGRGCPLVVHYWADLESVHGLRCYGNITRTRNVSEYMLVLALCLVVVAITSDVYVLLPCSFLCMSRFRQATGIAAFRVRNAPSSTLHNLRIPSLGLHAAPQYYTNVQEICRN